MKAFDAWLEDLADRALPGGVAAAAVAAAIGAALVMKVAQTTLRRRSLPAPDRRQMQDLVDLVPESRQELLHLAEADEQAYRRVLQTRNLSAGVAERRQAWRGATEVPLRVAEACQALLLRMDRLSDTCWPAVVTDLRVGRRLLAAGLESGLEAAEENLRAWGVDPDALPLRARLDRLREERVP
ncbi:MAG: cyclodeaminase/cyclohydrolase family protein [Anaerolineae bacterium]|nr:cyclodeaminase/cyclohydrolase family protein [Anaerolineae bacterium]